MGKGFPFVYGVQKPIVIHSLNEQNILEMFTKMPLFIQHDNNKQPYIHHLFDVLVFQFPISMC